MLRTLTVSLSVLLTAASAHADVLSERVVLAVSGKQCPNWAGYEVYAVPLFADGQSAPINTSTPYVVPWGFALEVTDFSYATGVFDDAIIREIQVNACSNNGSTYQTLYRHLVGPMQMRNASMTTGATGYVGPRGTRDVSFGSGLLVTYQARVCVKFVLDTNYLELSNREIRLRGRLHALANVPPQPPPGGGDTVK